MRKERTSVKHKLMTHLGIIKYLGLHDMKFSFFVNFSRVKLSVDHDSGISEKKYWPVFE